MRIRDETDQHEGAKQQPLMELARQSSRVSAFDWDIDKGLVESCGFVKELFSLSAELFCVGTQWFLPNLHPDDREAAYGTLNLAAGTPEEVQFEHCARYLLPSGKSVWIHTKAQKTLSTDQGTPRILRLRGTLENVTREREREEHFASILESIGEGFVTFDENWNYTFVNKRAEVLLGRKSSDLIGKSIWELFPETVGTRLVLRTGQSGNVPEDKAIRDYEIDDFKEKTELSRKKLHTLMYSMLRAYRDICALKRQREGLEKLVEDRTAELAQVNQTLREDVARREQAERDLIERNAELNALNAQLSSAQEHLIQSEKLASIGQLAAGVAHEINNPIGYIFSNFGSLEKYLTDLFGMLAAYEASEASQGNAQALASIRELKASIDLEFLKEDIPTLMHESKEGIVRVRKIVQDLKDFSHVDATQEWQFANLNQCIDSTLNVVNNEIKYKADVIKEYGELPEVQCMASQINQVVMNLVVNAAHAMGAERGKITVRTGVADGNAWFEVQDTGAGIPKEVLPRIFDPFYTTKPVGKGTGLGLSLSYGIIQKHHGHIDVVTDVGRGTSFRVTLPIQQEAL